jgi:hypothetical protein
MYRPKKDKETMRKLDAIKHSRGRVTMPRPTVFKDKTKYDRNAQKKRDRDLER